MEVEFSKNPFVWALSILLVLVVFLAFTGILYGEKIHEEEKAYSRESTFEFDLTEGDEHSINIAIAYSATMNRLQGRFHAQLHGPGGKQIDAKTFSISNSDESRSFYSSTEQNVFKFHPLTGTHMLTITEDSSTSIQGRTIKLKVFRK